jgi:MFS transporter, SP family, general alpha glucoside:H+ symporter
MDTTKVASAHIEGKLDYTDEQLASLGNQEEHEVGKLAAFRKHPWACAWCFYSVLVVLLSAFENQASGLILGIPQFRQDFGEYYNGEYVITAEWQGAFNSAPVAS